MCYTSTVSLPYGLPPTHIITGPLFLATAQALSSPTRSTRFAFVPPHMTEQTSKFHLFLPQAPRSIITIIAINTKIQKIIISCCTIGNALKAGITIPPPPLLIFAYPPNHQQTHVSQYSQSPNYQDTLSLSVVSPKHYHHAAYPY